MDDRSPAPEAGQDRIRRRTRGQRLPSRFPARRSAATAPAPRWVKVFGLIGVAVVLLIIILLLTGHGPSRHLHSAPGSPSPVKFVALDERGL
jgi:hypothetical protein